MRGDRTEGSLRERISLMFRERTREGRPFREAKRVRFPFSSTNFCFTTEDTKITEKFNKGKNG
jgi:hypothetical protein